MLAREAASFRRENVVAVVILLRVLKRASDSETSTSVILAGKRDSRRHSTTSFNENVIEAGTSRTSYQI